MKQFIKKHPFIVFLILLPLVTVLSLSLGKTILNPFSENTYEGLAKVLLKLRTLRVIAAFVVGGALAAAGTAYQAVLRNPLAEPFILGISGGASIGASLAIITGFAGVSFLAIPGMAFIGALIILSAVLLMARGAGLEYTNNVMLSGVIAGSVCASILMFIISISNSEDINSITWWLLGNLQARNQKLMLATSVCILAGLAVLFSFGREANVLSLGEEMAYHLGFSPLKAIIILLGTASFMTAAAVSLAGIIGFVGLIVPHILRRLFGADHRRLFPLSLLGGGMFVMICDTLSRALPGAQDLPVGVITSLLGGPFFIYLLNRKSREVQS